MEDKVTLKGSLVNLKGEFPNPGVEAEDITFVKTDLNEVSLYDYEGKVRVLISVPSVDTNVCAAETRKFNELLGSMGEDVMGFVISKDLPFALKRFCGNEGINNVIAVSDFRYGDFGNDFNAEMVDNVLKGLLARAVVVVDKENKITYSQLVPEILNEPDYDEVIEAVKASL